MKQNIIVTGVTGQDGSHMADYLLKNTNYDVYGGVRRLSVKNHDNIKHLENEPRFHLFDLELSDSHSIQNSIIKLKPKYFINFAAQSFVGASWTFPKQTFMDDSVAVLDMLESIRLFAPECRFYNAGSSEEFGDVVTTPQDETHPIRPRSPYGAAKAAARHLVKVYRESYGIYALQGWLFNHEGVRRGEDFVTRKISKAAARLNYHILSFDQFRYNSKERFNDVTPLEIGNIYSKRDWSDAEDFMDGVWKMLNQTRVNPKEYVLASNEMHSIKEFVERAFFHASLYGRWHENEDNPTESTFRLTSHNETVLVRINPKFFRENELDVLQGDPSLAEKELGWKRSSSFDGLVEKMVKHDIELNHELTKHERSKL